MGEKEDKDREVSGFFFFYISRDFFFIFLCFIVFEQFIYSFHRVYFAVFIYGIGYACGLMKIA